MARTGTMQLLTPLALLAALSAPQVQGFAPLGFSPPSSQRTQSSSPLDSLAVRRTRHEVLPTAAAAALRWLPRDALRVRNRRRTRSAVGSLASAASTAVTELPDSLQDAAVRAAQASASFADVAGPMARCRVDFDTTIGDETYTRLKSTTEFMQGLVTALSRLMIDGIEERMMDDQTRLVQARAELKQLESQAATTSAPAAGADVEGGTPEGEEEARLERERREEELIRILQNGGRSDEVPWVGPVVRVYFPDEGSAALARRDWANQHVPACVQFSSCGGVQQHGVDRDRVVLFYCPRASESESVEAILARQEAMSSDLKLTVFVNPYLVDMGVTGFGLAGRMLRERLIDPLQYTYYLRTLEWGALTRQWPNAYSVWQEDENEDGGYRLLQTLDRLPSNPEVEDIYDRASGGRNEGDGGGPGVLNQLGDFINGMMRL